MKLKVENNKDNLYCCDCGFDWVVIDEDDKSVFGANTEQECINYVNNYKEI